MRSREVFEIKWGIPINLLYNKLSLGFYSRELSPCMKLPDYCTTDIKNGGEEMEVRGHLKPTRGE